MIKGLIAIGTNSTRLLVANVDADSAIPLLQRSIGTRVGEGLRQFGRIDAEPMRRTLEAVRNHAAAIRERTGDLQVIATSAVRRASNAGEFARRVEAIAGAPLQIVSGDDEARYSYAGARSGLRAARGERFGVFDSGGGSTEYAIGTARTWPERIVSCEIGAVRLTEAVPELAGARGPIDEPVMSSAQAIVYRQTEPMASFERADRIVFVGGTATNAVALLRGSRDPFAYAELSLDDVARAVVMLRERDLAERKRLPAMNPQRADILLAGLIVLRVLFERSGHTRATASTNDLLLGYLTP